jgi:hypothetical protein
MRGVRPFVNLSLLRVNGLGWVVCFVCVVLRVGGRWVAGLEILAGFAVSTVVLGYYIMDLLCIF